MNTRKSSRKLLDMYGDSLKFVNTLLTREFGSSARKVPAHMPHLIDVDMVNQLMNQYVSFLLFSHFFLISFLFFSGGFSNAFDRWPEQFDETSSHQLRNSRDMQYAFSYFYFLMQQKVDFNLTEIWYHFIDTDRDEYVL